MNYIESKKILQSIKEAKNILIASHYNPDADSIGSILGLALVLKKLNKNVSLVCKDEVPEFLTFLKKSELIKQTDYKNFDFKKFDLIFALDSSRWAQIVGPENENNFPKANVVVVDHHMSNTGYGNINIIDKSATSTSEIVYKLLSDWKLDISKDVAESILTGMIGDTGSFRYPGLSADTFAIASELIKKGANRDKINFELYFNIDFNEIKYLAVVLEKAIFDKKNKIVWAAIPNSLYKKFNEPQGHGFAGTFFQTIKDSEMGILMVEKEKKVVEVSFRSRRNINAYEIAVELGGGGHRKAAGVKMTNMKFDDAVKKVLDTAKKYTKN